MVSIMDLGLGMSTGPIVSFHSHSRLCGAMEWSYTLSEGCRQEEAAIIVAVGASALVEKIPI